MKSVLVLAFVAIIAFCGGLTAPACVCDKRECEMVSEDDCPGLGVVVWDPCKYVKYSQNSLSNFISSCGWSRMRREFSRDQIKM